MEKSKDKIWADIFAGLSEVINKDAISTWFEPLVPVSLNNSTLVLGAPNNFFIEWISEYYSNPLMRVLSKPGFDGIKVDFTIVDNNDSANQEEPILTNSQPPSNPKPNSLDGSRLLPRYNFDNFIIGESNRFAFAAAKAVAGAPAKVYNPLFVYGGVGLGKTHLLHAIGNYIKKTQPNLKIY
jgi:chromosomal replication initiator protein